MTCRDVATGATHSAVALRLDRRAQDAVWLPWRRAADAAPITTDTVDAIARSEPGDDNEECDDGAVDVRLTYSAASATAYCERSRDRCCPAPLRPTSLPSSTTTSPRTMVVTGQPVTLMPS